MPVDISFIILRKSFCLEKSFRLLEIFSYKMTSPVSHSFHNFIAFNPQMPTRSGDKDRRLGKLLELRHLDNINDLHRKC